MGHHTRLRGRFYSLISHTAVFVLSSPEAVLCACIAITGLHTELWFAFQRLVFPPQSWLKLMGPLHQLHAQSVEGPSRGRTSG